MESKEEKDDQFQMKKEKDSKIWIVTKGLVLITNEGIDNIFY